jgi:hypothetical protein
VIKPMPAKTRRRLLEALAERRRLKHPGHEIEIVDLPAPDDVDDAVLDGPAAAPDDDAVDRQP